MDSRKIYPMISLQHLPACVAFVALALTSSLPARAVSEKDLLPVDQAFALGASAPQRDRIEVRWKVAEGYYLYRHRITVEVEGAGFQAGSCNFPKARPPGRVLRRCRDIPRGLTGVLAANLHQLDSVRLKCKYQGCADAGICYRRDAHSVG